MTLPAQDIVLDPLTILAGIEQFGLASDGCDLRDLKASISRLTADNEALRAAMDVTQRRAISAEARADALAQEVERLRGLLGYNNGKRE